MTWSREVGLQIDLGVAPNPASLRSLQSQLAVVPRKLPSLKKVKSLRRTDKVSSQLC